MTTIMVFGKEKHTSTIVQRCFYRIKMSRITQHNIQGHKSKNGELTDYSHPRIDDGSGRGRCRCGLWRHLLPADRVHRYRMHCSAVNVRGTIGRQKPAGSRGYGVCTVVGEPLQAGDPVARHR